MPLGEARKMQRTPEQQFFLVPDRVPLSRDYEQSEVQIPMCFSTPKSMIAGKLEL